MDRLERINKIMELLRENKKMEVKELSEIFSVSDVTIRKDLNYLSAKGLATRSHGSVRIYTELLIEPDYSEKEGLNILQKDIIAKRASEFISNGDTIFLAFGTTVSHICKYLDDKNDITVITNDLNTAHKLSGKKNIKLIVVGGVCRINSFSLIGPNVCEQLSSFYTSKAFISCSSFSVERGITTPLVNEGLIGKTMIKNSQKTFILADSSKYIKEAMYQLATLKEVDSIITDDAFPVEDIKKFKAFGSNLIIAK